MYFHNRNNEFSKTVSADTYDSLGNITGITDGEQNRTSFELDDWGRITTLHAPDGSSETYAYDAAGNRIRKQTESCVEGYTYDERNRLTERNVWKNGGTEPAETTTYIYDAQGSLLSEQGMDICKKYLYNDFHQCIRAEVIRGREAGAEDAACMRGRTEVQENFHDGEGLRFALTENGRRTDFITDGWENIAELDENGSVTRRIIRGNGIVASEDALHTTIILMNLEQIFGGQ